MDTTSKTRKARKFGSLAAGVVLCLGIVNMPSAFAEDFLDTDPAEGWIQAGEGTLSVSGEGCTSDIGGVAVIVSDTSDPADGWTTVDDHPDFDVQLDLSTGHWSALIITTDATILSTNDLSSTTGGGLPHIFAWCVDAGANPVIEYTPIQIGVTGLGTFKAPLGEDTTVEADGFIPGETVTFVLSGGAADLNLTIGTGTADENGHVSTTINIPTSVDLDDYTLTLTGSDSGYTWVGTLTVGTDEEGGDNGAGATTENTTDNTNKMPDLGAGVA